MSSERAGTPTHGTLNREAAREVLSRFSCAQGDRANPILGALGACVVPDPRLARIEALIDEWAGSTRSRITPDFAAREVHAILRSDQ